MQRLMWRLMRCVRRCGREPDSWESDQQDFISIETDHDVAFTAFIKRIPCFAHTLQLVVGKFATLTQFKEVLKSAYALIRKVNKI